MKFGLAILYVFTLLAYEFSEAAQASLTETNAGAPPNTCCNAT
jgi:hypothetical protein